MAKQLNVNLAFTADTSQAKAQLQSLQAQLSGLLNSTNKQSFGNQITGDINKASKAIAELKLHLKNATNVNTGNLDFTKLNESLNKSGTTLQQYGDKLRSLGPAGQQAFNTLASSIAQSEIPIRRSNAALTELWTTLKNTVRWQISSSILHGFMGTISGAVGYAKDLNKSLNDIRIVTGASVDEMARFAEQANRSAKALSASTTAYTKASLIYYQQGLDDQAVKERTDVTIKMANVSGQSAETVSDQMTAVWNNFAKGGENLERFADVMVRLGADTASSSDEIAQGLEKFAAIGDMVGLSFDNAAAALATVTATTRQSADVVGTAFKTIFARIQGLKLGETLEDGTDLNKYSEVLAAVGISIKEQNGELKDMDNILAEMGAKWKTLSKDQQVALAQTVAGLRQYNQLVALMENFDFYEQNLQSAKNAEGSLQEQADIYAESWQAASDRVKAATQGIYEDLLNDEAFIDILNTIEKILTYVDNLIDGLGGLGGVLTTVGVLLTRVFSTQIAQSITGIVNSIKMMTAAGREQAQQQKAQFMKDSADAMRNMSDGSNEGNMRAAMMEDQLRLQTSMIENSERMSAEEQQINQMLLDRQRILSDNAIAAAKELDVATEARSDATFNARVELAQEARGWAGGDLEVQKKNLSDFTKQFNQVQQKLKQGITARVNLEELRKLPVEGEKGKQIIDKIKQAVDKIDDTEIKEIVNSLDTMELNAESVEDAIAALTIRLREMQSTSEANMMDENNEWMLSEDAVHGLSTAYEDEAMAALRTRDAEEQANEARDNAAHSINNATGAQKFWADQMVAGANVVMSFMSVLQAFSGIIDVATNPDMSGWEKFLSIGSSLAMMFVMLAPLLQGTNLQFLAMISSTVAAKVGLKGTRLAALEASAATGKLSASLWTLLWPIGLVIAAIAALVGIIALIGNEINNNKIASLEGQLESAKNASEEFGRMLNEAQQEAQNLQDAFNQYDSVMDTLKGCEKGTEEWKKALQAVNTEVLNLLESYPELMNYVDANGQSGIYRDEATGVLTVNENFFVDQQNKMANQIEKATVAKLMSDRRDADLTVEQATQNFQDIMTRKGHDVNPALHLEGNGSVSDKFYDDLLAYYTGDSKQNIDDILADYALKHMSAGGQYIDKKGNPQFINEKSTDEQRIASIINSGMYTTEKEIDENIQRIVTEWKEAFGEAGSELNKAFTNAARVTTETANAIETASKTITTTVLQDNQKVQNSKYADNIIDAAAKQYERYYQEAFKQKSDEGFGTIGVNQGDTEKDKAAQRYFKEYIEALGKNIDDYELIGVTGDDEARKYQYKTKDGTEAEIDINGMIDAIVTSELKSKINEFSNGLIDIVELIDNSINNATDEIQKKSLEATKDFLLNQDFYDSSLLELNELQNQIDTFGNATDYLNSIFGGKDQLLSDEEAQALGYNSAKEMIRAFENTLKEVDLSNFSQTIQDIIDKGADLTAATAAAYDNMIDGDFGTTDADTFIGPMPQDMDYDAIERNRFDIAVQGGLSEDPKEMTEELIRMVELLEQAPAGFQNLSEAADKIESSSIAEFNEELQDVIDTFNDYGDLDFTDIADGVIDEDEAKDLDINTKSLKKYIDMLEKTEDGAGKTRDELMELAEASLKTAKAFSDLKDDWKDYRKNLQSGDIAKQADAIAKIGDAFKGVFGFDLSELDISDTFLTDAENIQLVEDAINGVDGALEKLQSKLFNEIIIDVIGEEQLDLVMQDISDKHQQFKGMSFEAAFTADPSGFLQALAESQYAAQISASAIQAAVSAMGYSMTYETETAETTQTAQTDGGYSWQTVPGTPFKYEYIKNTEPGEEPVQDSITITPVGLKKIPNPPVEVSATQLTGGSATNYKFGDGTSTNNSVSMADIKNIKVNKKTQTPTSRSVKGASPIVNTGSNPAGSGGGKGRGGGGKGGGGTSSKPAKKSLITKKSDTVERYKEINDQLKKVQDTIEDTQTEVDQLWGASRLTAMKKVKKALQDELELQKEYKNQIRTNRVADRQAIENFMKEMPNGELGGLGNFGLKFEFDENGFITNYTSIMEFLHGKLNELETQKNNLATEEAQSDFNENTLSPFKNKLDYIKELISQYDDTSQLLIDKDNEIRDKINEIRERAIEEINYQVEMKIEVNENALSIIEYYLNETEDNFYKVSEAASYLSQETGIAFENLGLVYKSYTDILNKYNNGEDNILFEDVTNAAKETVPKMLEYLGNINDIDKEMLEYYGDALDSAKEQFDEYSVLFDASAEKLDHFKSMLSLTRREMNYEQMGAVLKGQYDVTKNTASANKEYFVAMQQEYNALQERWNRESESLNGYEKEPLKQKLYDAKVAVSEAENEYLASLNATGEIAQEILQNNLDKAKKKLEENLVGSSLEDYMTSLDRLSRKQEEYLTTTNKMYETNKLIRQAQLDMDKTDNNRAKQQYNDYVKYIEQLQKSGDLSQYELSIAQAKYELLQAEIALEEAQDAKSQVRLTRDSEGNYGYVYTANEDKVAEVEQALADAENKLYNIGLDGAKDYQSKYAETMQEAVETFEAINEQYRTGQIATEEEYNAKMLEAQNYYYGLLEQYNDLYYIGHNLLVEESYKKEADYLLLGVQDLENFKTHTDTYLTNAKDYFDDYDYKVLTVRETVGSNLGEIQTETNKVTAETGKLADEVRNKLIPELEEELLHVRVVTSEYGKQRETLQTVIDKNKEYIEQLQKISEYGVVDKSEIGDYSTQIEQLIASGVNPNSLEIQRLLALRWEKMGGQELYHTNIKAEMEEEFAKNGESAWYKTLQAMRDYKIIATDWSAYKAENPDATWVDDIRSEKMNTDFAAEIAAYLKYNGTSVEDDYVQDRLAARQAKIDEQKITGVETNKQLIARLLNEKEIVAEQAITTTAATILSGSNDEEKIWNFFKAQGFTNAGIAGLMGNLFNESGLKSNNVQDGFGYTDIGYTSGVDNETYTRFVNDSIGYGLAQWTEKSRKQGLLNYANQKGTSISDLNTQLEYLLKELETSFPQVLKVLKTTNSIAEASNKVLTQYEMPANQGTGAQRVRANSGQKYYNKYASYDTGGYTGDWGPEGRLAMLHEKELILNKQDTTNFLTATQILREISQILDNNALVASLGAINLHAMTIGTPADQVLQQEVTIHADFPNVTDHNEIEIAIDNLINAASQHAYKA